VLEQKLQHLRSWMHQLQMIAERNNKESVQNSRRLFVGGVPDGVTDVSSNSSSTVNS
jgi:hypothetical protein